MYHIHLKPLIKDVGVFVRERFVHLDPRGALTTSTPKPMGEGKAVWSSQPRVLHWGRELDSRTQRCCFVVKVTKLVHFPYPHPFPSLPQGSQAPSPQPEALPGLCGGAAPPPPPAFLRGSPSPAQGGIPFPPPRAARGTALPLRANSRAAAPSRAALPARRPSSCQQPRRAPRPPLWFRAGERAPPLPAAGPTGGGRTMPIPAAGRAAGGGRARSGPALGPAPRSPRCRPAAPPGTRRPEAAAGRRLG